MAKKKRNKEQIADVDIILTAKELKLLVDEPPELMKLYILLSNRRDFGTNIAGKVVRLDDHAFKEWMDYPGKPGRKAWKPSTTHITRWLDQLEFLGLIKQLGNYVFELPLAFVSESMQKISHQNVTNNVTTFVTNSNTTETSINKDKSDKSELDLSPPLSPPLSLKVYTPQNIYISKVKKSKGEILESYPQGSFRQVFYDLLKDRNYGLDAMIDPHTGAMLAIWESKGVTNEDVKSGMEYCDIKKGGSPRYPSLYQDWVLNAMRARLNAEQEINNTSEVTHVRQRQGHPHKESSVHRVRRRLAEIAAENAIPCDEHETDAS